MKSWLILTALGLAMMIPASSEAQYYGGRIPARKSSYGGIIVAQSNDCGCNRCRPVNECCFPRILPSILEGLGRVIDCILPSCGQCGCQSCCTKRAPTCGCSHEGMTVIESPTLVPPKPVPDRTSYHKARRAQAARAARVRKTRTPYQASSNRRPAARRNTPTPARKRPELQPVPQRTVNYPSGVKILTASYTKSGNDEQATTNKPASRPRLPFSVPVNPLRK